MREGGSIIYKCRQCGKVYAPTHTPDALASIVFAASGLDMNPKVTGDPTHPRDLFDIHTCNESRRGIADMIGAHLDKKGGE